MPAPTTSPARAELVLHTAAARRNQRHVDEHGLDPIDLGLGTLDRDVSLVALRFRRDERRLGRVRLGDALIEDLLGEIALLDELLAALELALGQGDLLLRCTISAFASARPCLAFSTWDWAPRSCASYSGEEIRARAPHRR